MCAIVGLLSTNEVGQTLYDALISLQHRGQDAAGLLTSDGQNFVLRRGNGLVSEVITADDRLALRGRIGLGHVRYPTAGSAHHSEAQPFYVNAPYGLAMVHNGNLVNTTQLTQHVTQIARRHLSTHSDSELLLNLFASELQTILSQIVEKGGTLPTNAIFSAVQQIIQRCTGAYAVLVFIAGHGLLAFRDPNGIRPLVLGRSGNAYMVASESSALQTSGFKLEGDIAPGEAIFIDLKGQCHRRQCAEQAPHTPCIFEYIYLARADSILNKISVYQVRQAMGRELAKRITKVLDSDVIDVVIPIPETSCTAALQLAETLGLRYCEGLIKNRYIGRTFIMPEQEKRERSVRQKLNSIDREFAGKNVLLVDDSVVRGTTSKQVVELARRAGARHIYFASVAPQVRYPNLYGVDIPSKTELIAAENRSDQAIAKYIGADTIIFQKLDGLYNAMRQCGSIYEQFEDSIFTGKYITGQLPDDYFKQLAQLRASKAIDLSVPHD